MMEPGWDLGYLPTGTGPSPGPHSHLHPHDNQNQYPPRSTSANGFTSSTGSRPSSPPPGSPLRIPRRSSSHLHTTFAITAQKDRKPLFQQPPSGNGNGNGKGASNSNSAHRRSKSPAATTTASHIPVPTTTTSAASATTPSTTPLGTPSKGHHRRSQSPSFSGSAPGSATKTTTTPPMSKLKKRSSVFTLKKAWLMAGDEDNAASHLGVDSPTPASRLSTGIPVLRREADPAGPNTTNTYTTNTSNANTNNTDASNAVRTRSATSSKSSLAASDDYRSLGESATTAASSVMKGSHDESKENDAKADKTSKRSSFFDNIRSRPRAGDADGHADPATEANFRSSQMSAASGHSPTSSIHSAASQKAPESNRERIKDWGKQLVTKAQRLPKRLSTNASANSNSNASANANATDDRDTKDKDSKDRVRRRKSTGWFSSQSHDPMPSIDGGGTPQDIPDASPLSRPASVAEESPNKAYSWQVDEDFTASSLQVSDSPMLKFNRATQYSQPDFTGVGEEVARPPSSGRRPPSGGRNNSKIDEIRQRERDAEEAIPLADPAAPRPKNTKLDDIRQREIDGITARTVANLRMEELREINSKARSSEGPLPGSEARSSRERAYSSALAASRSSSHLQQRPPSAAPESNNPDKVERETEDPAPGQITEAQPSAPLPTIGRAASRGSLVSTTSGARKLASSLHDEAATEAARDQASGADRAPESAARDGEDVRRSRGNTPSGQFAPGQDVARQQFGQAGGANPAFGTGLGAGRSPTNVKQIAPSGFNGSTSAPSAAIGAAIPRITTPHSFNSVSAGHTGNAQPELFDRPDNNTNANTNANAKDNDQAAASSNKSKLPTRSTNSSYSSLPKTSINPSLRRAVSSNYDRTKLTGIVSAPLPPETTTTTVTSTSARPPSEPSSLRSLKSLESLKQRTKHGRKMDDDPTNRIEAERNLFSYGGEGSERGSLRSPSPAPILESEDEDEEENLYMPTKHAVDKTFDNDATPRPAKKTYDPLSMPTPKISGAYVETPATVKPAIRIESDTEDEEIEFQPRRLFRPSPLRQGAGDDKGGKTSEGVSPAVAAGFGLGAAVGASVGAAFLASNTVSQVPPTSKLGISDLFAGACNASTRNTSTHNASSGSTSNSGADSDPETTESSRKAREAKAAEAKAATKRRARSLSHRRRSIPNSVRPPTLQDDLAELNRLHQVEDSSADTTLDEFEREAGDPAAPSFTSSFSSETFEKMMLEGLGPEDEADMEKWEKIEHDAASGSTHDDKEVDRSVDDKSYKNTEEDDSQTQEEAIARLAKRLSTATLPGLRDARRGLTKLEDQVSSPEKKKAERGTQIEARADDGTQDDSPLSRKVSEPARKVTRRPSQQSSHRPLTPEPTPEPEPATQAKTEEETDGKTAKTTTALVKRPRAPIQTANSKTNKSWLSTFVVLVLLALAWYGAEWAVCKQYCRPITCDTGTCVWDPSDPTFGTALPTKLDQWVTNGAAGELLIRASDVITDVWDGIFGRESEAYVVGKGFASRRRVARRIRKRREATGPNGTSSSSPSRGLAMGAYDEHDEEQQQRWKAWRLARQAREKRFREEERAQMPEEEVRAGGRAW